MKRLFILLSFLLHPLFAQLSVPAGGEELTAGGKLGGYSNKDHGTAGQSNGVWRVDVTKPDDLARLMDVIPVGAKVGVLIAWFFGSLIGGAVAMQIARNRIAPWIVAAFIVAGGLFSFATIPHPLWMMVGGVTLPILAALLVVRRMRGDSAPS